MPIDPMTGIADYGGQGRSGLPGGDVSTPFIFDLMESIPGVSTTTMINAGRYSNTLFARWSI
jgi:hypothetical protein